jgi:hypothetical protein
VDVLERQIENEQQRQRELHRVALVNPRTMALEPDPDEVARERATQSLHEQRMQERREEAERREHADAVRRASVVPTPGFG